ncbi:MAG: ATP-binding protein, partial [Prochloron sp. SP5CPC1]|nr:ATP-binding protein [Candidatus Paraprochloron terpiosi SP5CPC1]
MLIRRQVEKHLLRLKKQYPVITITGPRQSGKTTLAKLCFPRYFYSTLEDLDTRQEAQNDPRGFLEKSPHMIIDEIQKVPSLVSYIQGITDKSKKTGQFILTGSHHFQLTATISQSLAGRTALIHLLPFSMKELKSKEDYTQLLYRGFYPRIIDKKLKPKEALSFYINTYIQRDLRDIKEIKNLKQFERFLKLSASFTGQIVNKVKFANDIGVDSKTIDSWLSILEASY